MDRKHTIRFEWLRQLSIDHIIIALTLFPFLITYPGFLPAEIRFQFFVLCLAISLLVIIYSVKLWTYKLNVSVTLIDIFYILGLCYAITTQFISRSEFLFTYDSQDVVALLIMYPLLRGGLSGNFSALFFKVAGIMSLFFVAEVMLGIFQNPNFWDISESQERVRGSFIDNSIYSHFLILNLPFLASLFEKKPSSIVSILKVAALVIILLLIRESRISLLALPVGLFFIYFFNPQKVVRNAWLLVGLFIFILCLCSALAFNNLNSLKGRVLVWQIGTEIWKDFPITGVGYGNFNVVYPAYQHEYFKDAGATSTFQHLAGDINEPYNEILNLLIEQGLIGLIIHLALLFMIVKTLTRDSDILKRYLLVSLGLFYFIGISSFPLSSLSLKVNYLLIVILCSMTCKPVVTFRSNKKFGIALIVLIFLTCSAFNFRNFKELLGIKKWIFYNSYNKTSDDVFAQVIKSTPSNLKYNIYYLLDLANFQFRKRDFRACIETVIEAKKLTKNSYFFILHAKALIELKKYELAYSELKFVKHLIPNLVYPKYLMVKVLLNMKKEKEALQLIEEILVMPIKVRTVAIEEIIDEMHRSKVVLNNK